VLATPALPDCSVAAYQTPKNERKISKDTSPAFMLMDRIIAF
jgi:hypothetical protein